MLKWWNRIINEPGIDIREKVFRIVMLVMLLIDVITICGGFTMGNGMENFATMAAFLLTVFLSCILTFKYHRSDISETILGVSMVCITLPLCFFQNGGIESGAPVWFLMGSFYIFLLMRGKKLVLFTILFIVTILSCYCYAYFKPESLIYLLSKPEAYFDSAFAVIVAGILVGLLLRFQMTLSMKERELTLEQKEELERLTKSKNDFFAKISRDIKTPISVIMNLNELNMRGTSPEEMMENTVSIEKAVRQLNLLVEDLLDLANMEQGVLEIEEDGYELKELLNNLAERVQLELQNKKLNFDMEVEKGLPCKLIGDRKRVEQVIFNLLANAIQYTEKGRVGLTIKEESRTDDKIRLKIVVSDTGIGIRQEEFEHLFDPFEQDMGENKHRNKGTGLGLAITKQLVTRMNGELEVSSNYKKGSRFTILLEQEIMNPTPVGKVDYETLLHLEERTPYRRSFVAPGARILIVDETEKSMLPSRRMLRDTEIKTDFAASSEECYEKVKRKSYNVILMESRLGDITGAELLQRIRTQENGLCRNTPVIAYTTDAVEINSRNYAELGFDDYLPKPVRGKQLENAILKFLPDELVEYREDEDEYMEGEKRPAHAEIRRAKRLVITSDCASDIPDYLLKQYDISLFYFYIKTKSGTFMDVKEINIDNLASMMTGTESMVQIINASEEAYEEFFADVLENAEEVIHICVASRTGTSYTMASEAAKRFAHVRVIDSGHISGGEALLTLYAADMVKAGCRADEVCEELEQVKKRISSSFFLPHVNIFYESGFTDRFTAKMCKLLRMHPIMRVRKSKPTIVGLKMGGRDDAAIRFVRHHLRQKRRIDNRVLYVTYAGMTIKQKNAIMDEINKCMYFENVIVQKASATCSSNGGLGTLGISYMYKKESR